MKNRCNILFTGALLLGGATLFAQPGGGGGGQGQGGPPPGGTGAPVDGGAISLVIGAVAYGYSQYKQRLKNSTPQNRV